MTRPACLFLALMLLLSACSALNFESADAAANQPAPTLAPPSSQANSLERPLSEIYQSASPAVVNIEAVIFAEDGSASETRRGSGFVYDQQGHIISNAHLVADVDAIQVTLGKAYVLEAQLLGFDSFSDLAVLKVATQPERLRPLRIGASAPLQVGQPVIAIGNPFGLNSSMTAGIISGLGRTLPAAELNAAGGLPGVGNPAIIQIDATINPGNSGGPLLDAQGLVIGIATAMRSDNGSFQGIGFAVPADTMRRVIPELIERGRVEYAWLGISVMREDGGYGLAGLSEALDLPVERGVLLRGVSEGSPAQRAGLRGGDTLIDLRGEAVCVGGDIIIAINGYHFADLDGLATYLVQNSRPGDTVELLVIRGKSTLELTLTLESRPAEERLVIDCAAARLEN